MVHHWWSPTPEWISIATLVPHTPMSPPTRFVEEQRHMPSLNPQNTGKLNEEIHFPAHLHESEMLVCCSVAWTKSPLFLLNLRFDSWSLLSSILVLAFPGRQRSVCEGLGFVNEPNPTTIITLQKPLTGVRATSGKM